MSLSCANQNCVGIVRPFLISLLWVRILRQNRYRNGDGHFVHPMATSNACRRPCRVLGDGEGFRMISVTEMDGTSFPLVERPVLSLTLSISLAQSHCPWSPSFLYHNDYQSSSHRQPRKKQSAEPRQPGQSIFRTNVSSSTTTHTPVLDD